MRHREVWTTEEDDVLKSKYATWPIKKLAKEVGRTPAAIGWRASYLGLKKEVRSPYRRKKIVKKAKRTGGGTNGTQRIKRSSQPRQITVNIPAHFEGNLTLNIGE